VKQGLALDGVDRPLSNSYWVIPGRLLGGEHPAAVGRYRIAERLSRLRDAGIQVYVDLTEMGELPEYRSLLTEDDEYVRSAIVDAGVPYNPEDTRKVLASIRAALARGASVYVHCRAGIGRTGLVMGCFLADAEASGKTALAKLNSLWRHSDLSATWPKIPQTTEQADYIRRWPTLNKMSPRGPDR
jgi:hypothetical protein